MDRFFVVTGGPGSGKSALLAELAVRGLPHMPEGGRAIIRAQLASGGTALPWADRDAFAALMTDHDRQSYGAALAIPGLVLFDRGIPDVIGYRRLCGLACPDDLIAAARTMRYNRDVFIAPPWQAIYENDAERRQDWPEAVATCEAMARTYRSLGYRLVSLPLVPVAQRADFIMEHCSAGAGSGRA